jgi:hypothetical protein
MFHITMKSKHLVVVSLVYFNFLGGLSCWAQAAADDVWVAIRVVDNGVAQPTTEYYGTIDEKTLASLSNLPVGIGFLKLQHVSWMDNGQIVAISRAKPDGIDYGYGDVAYFRIDTMLRIIVLDDTFVKQHSLEPKVTNQ